MAYQLAQAYVQIVPSMKGVGKAIESAFAGPSKSVGQKAGDTAGGGFSRGFSAKLGMISGIAQSVAGTVIQGFAGLSSQIVEASDSTQKFASTLGFAGVSDAEIRKLTKSTQDYADKTVFGLSDIRNTTAQLAANGVPNYDKLAEAAGNLTAVAGGGADAFKSVAMVLTQTAGAGKLTTENWNQLSDAIPGASGKLQQAMLQNGAYTGNFRDAMANGEITADEFNQALMQLGMSDTAIQAATSASTMEGAMGNLEASAVKLGSTMLDSVKPALTGFIGWASDGISAATPVIQAGIQGVIGWMQDLWKALNDNGAVTAFKSAWNAIRNAIMGVVNMVIDWSKLAPPDTLANAIKLVADALNWFVQHGNTLIPIIIGIGTAFAAVKGYQALNNGLTALTNTMNTVTTAAQGVSKGVMLMMDMGGPIAAIQQLTSKMKLAQAAQEAWSAVTKTATAVQGAFNAVMAATGGPIVWIIGLVAAIVAALTLFFTQTEVSRQLWADFTGFLQTAWQNITDFFQTTCQNITQWFSNAAANIQNGWNALTAFIGSVPGRIQAFFAGIGQWFANKFNEVRNGIANGFNSAVSFIASIPGRILSALGNLGGLLWNAGASIMQGFLDGLKSIWHNITSFVGNIAGWIADHKGPLPYDRKLLIPAGEAIMGGFRKSLNAGWQQVQADIMGMNVGLSNGFKTPAYVYGGSGMDYTPNTGSASNVHITNYYPQADPWPLSTNDSLDKMTVGI
ncbi:tape measure protein [Bifidobacterium longum]|uniref:Tape measure protein N-terminal domain-containing protein n=2 Tax=Bifidobacterium longum subsp. infantis TaxID=1682 RepID=A0ABP1XCH3_BIFLI|nr:tape measure protein [Bifidobacterium longum]ACJ52898.1 phage tape measure protein [Bifidobacterium longum subsp. infantis ATCC 15697 = JCM 1222 = DSM 20088]CEF00034.1 hypothetical protein BLIC_a01988 [Bifidobacterium longum subsp. infantis]CEF03070.1 hypothetical protein BLIC_b01999 [Bifidobacterium longum subsp. infantis]CEF04382.1 hypothetical protein BLIC_c01999 [Bifidobacterium longum subsp. infantis]CEF09165.1 hypothetical protein BLIC_e02012 [Bifidobacterium longum subsp. infantis]